MLKIGDKVRILDGRGWAYWIGAMNRFVGMEGVIKNDTVHHHKNCWYVDGPMNGYFFQEEKLEFIEPVKVLNTYRELYAEAVRRKIAGRSNMNREELRVVVYGNLPAPVVVPVKPAAPAKPSLYEQLKGDLPAGKHICSFALEDETGNRAIHALAPCHAGLSRLYYNNELGVITDVVDDISSHVKHHDDKPAYELFVTYMLNQSPWKDCFVTKKFKDAVEGGVHYDTNVPISRLVCSAMALRQGSEHHALLNMWKFLTDEGYSANVSWFITQGVAKKAGGGYLLNGLGGGHDVFEHSMNAEDVVKFFKEGWHMPADIPYKNAKNKGYEIFKSIARLDVGEDLKDFFKRNIKCQVKGKGWNKVEIINTLSVLTFAEQMKKLIEA